MSAALAMPCIVATTTAVAEPMPLARPKPIAGYAFYRKHTLGLLHRYLRISMEIGRAPSALGRIVLRGRVSSYRLRTFEDGMIFVLDVQKALNHVALEDYTIPETAALMGESERSVGRIYGEAMDRLTACFLQFGLLEPNVEKLSRGEAKIESNEAT
jgi:hypothetical protein